MIKIINQDYKDGLKDIEDKTINLIVTDPPYSFNPRGSGKNSITEKRDYLKKVSALNCCKFNPIEFLNLIKPKLKKFAGFFFCNKLLLPHYLNWTIEYKMNFDLLIMAKNNPIPTKNNHHLPDLEYIVYIREPGTFFSKHKTFDDFRKFYLDKRRKNNLLHPAEKPLELIERFIRVGSKENDLIIDPFAGSGTTALAAAKNNRNFIGFEINEDYSILANKRIAEELKT